MNGKKNQPRVAKSTQKLGLISVLGQIGLLWKGTWPIENNSFMMPSYKSRQADGPVLKTLCIYALRDIYLHHKVFRTKRVVSSFYNIWRHYCFER